MAITNVNPFPDFPVAELMPGGRARDTLTVITPAIQTSRKIVSDYLNVSRSPGGQSFIVPVRGDYGTGKTHLSIALGVQAARRGHRVAFASAQDWVGRLGQARRGGKLEEELERWRRIPLVIVDEVGYIPFDPEAASLFFSLISSRYERASLIVSSNKTFSAWAEIFGDAVAVGAMVDRLVHHAEVIVLQGDSYRLKDRAKEVLLPDSH